MSLLASARPLSNPMPLRAAVYCRISYDKKKDKHGVERQERIGRRITAERGFSLDERHVFIDPSRSAWKRDRRRPAWDALIAAVDAGEIDVIVCVDADRLMRQPRDLEDLLRYADQGILLVGEVRGYDLSDPDDRYNLRILIANACKESDYTSRRVKRHTAEKAEAGEYHGGMRRYGFEPDGLTLRESEAEAIRTLVRMRLRGDGWLLLIRWANGEGHRTATGLLWTMRSMRELLLTSPYIAGLRQHRGQIIGKAVWPAIISADDWYELQRVNEIRAARYGYTGTPHRFYEARGLPICGRCGKRLTGRKSARAGGRSESEYSCTKAKGGCGGLSIKAAWLEELVGVFCIARLQVTDLHAARSAADGESLAAHDAEVATLLARKAELAAEWGSNPAFTMAEWKAAKAPLEARLAELERDAKAARRTSTVAVEDMTGPDAAQRWAALSPERRNAIARTYIEAVVVAPGRRGTGFDPDRVQIVPRAV